MNICFTICSINYLHYALVCRESFLKYNSSKYDFAIIIMDMIDSQTVVKDIKNYTKQGINIKCFYDIKNEINDFPIEEMLCRYNVLEINKAIRPFAFEYFSKKGYEKVMYTSPDTKFYQPITEADEALDTNNCKGQVLQTKKQADSFCQEQYFFNHLPCTNFKIEDSMRNSLLNYYKNTGKFPFNADRKTMCDYLRYSKSGRDTLVKPAFGVNIIGYINDLHSIGEIVRGLIKHNFSAGIPFSLYYVCAGKKQIPNIEKDMFKRHLTTESLYPINIIVMNADWTIIANKRNPELYEDKYNVGIWFWEFESGFDKFVSAFDYLDEIWVQSDFILNTLKKYRPDKKIKKLKAPIILNPKIIYDKEKIRQEYNIRDDEYTFFFNFDYNSSYDRKNPEGILSAFAKAFKNNENVKLVIKTINVNADKKNQERFNNLVSKLGIKEKVLIIDEFLSRDKMTSLINACDVYVSLHRGEGLGLGMMEAMSLGKPVIGTNYGGNTDFMNNENSLLVDYILIKPETDFEVYKDVELWADPNIDTAAQYMYKLYYDRDFAKEIGEKALSSIKKDFGDIVWNTNFYDLLENITIKPTEPKLLLEFNLFKSLRKLKHNINKEQIFSVKILGKKHKKITILGLKMKIKM